MMAAAIDTAKTTIAITNNLISQRSETSAGRPAMAISIGSPLIPIA
jgi:hypothetical protein